MGEKITKEKSKYDRGWKLAQQTARNCNKSFASKIEQARKKEIVVTNDFITQSLKCVPNFLGCYAEDQLETLKLTGFPCFLIANIDSSNMKGTHWISIGIFKNKIEIFDSLGFDIFNWNRVPCSLLNFLHNLSVSRRVLIAPCIQSNKSALCGFYSMYYVIRRAFSSFSDISNCFDTHNLEQNDLILSQFFNK